MRTLVLQLARFGDIYQSWPVLRALRRGDPDGELHVLVRSRFADGLRGLDGVIPRVLPTPEILGSILQREDVDGAHARLTDFLSGLGSFDRIVNLSFSPASSFLTDILSTGPEEKSVEARGYTRHADGFLSIPDDPSAYFYAQVGIGRANRYALTDLFAAVAGVDLRDEDFLPPSGIRVSADTGARENRVVVHLGASQAEKTYPPELWARTLSEIKKVYNGKIILIGSADEKPLADGVLRLAGDPEVDNRVGATGLDGVFTLLASARLLIGADSAPVHMAALTATPVLNLSCAAVNFHETGPQSAGSRVLHAAEMHQLAPGRVVAEALAMLKGEVPTGPCYTRAKRGESWRAVDLADDDFTWALAQALYTGTPYPPARHTADKLAFQRLFEVAELALAQFDRADGGDARMLGMIDELLEEIPRLHPPVDPVVQWFQTQRLRLGPAPIEDTRAATRRLFEELLWVSAVYRAPSVPSTDAARAVALCESCSAELRDYRFKEVEDDFQILVSLLQDLARHSTKVGERSWSSVLFAMNDALHRRDFIDLADQLEYELKPHLKTLASDVVF
jgi:ADP-heptose:LPS heptosyltransferase